MIKNYRRIGCFFIVIYFDNNNIRERQRESERERERV